jgi:hypothetical protein
VQRQLPPAGERSAQGAQVVSHDDRTHCVAHERLWARLRLSHPTGVPPMTVRRSGPHSR